MAEGGQELLRRGWDALSDADWETARRCFEGLTRSPEAPRSSTGSAGRCISRASTTAAIELTEQAFAAYRQEGKIVEAADRARWLAFLHGAVKCNLAVAGGWMGRAASLFDEADECAGHGWLAVDRAPLTDNIAEREQLAATAIAIARRHGDIDLEYDAMALLGEAYVAGGRVREGMQLIDEAMTAVSAGEVVGIVAVGDICCRLLGACELALDVARAEQWMSVAGPFDAWSEWVSPVCRTHYGGILIAVGRWSEAETELTAAIGGFEHSYRLMLGSPLVKLADLRVRQGRLDEARRLLEGKEARPAARLALAAAALGARRGRPRRGTRRALPGGGSAQRPGLELLVRARLARADIAGAAEARGRLDEAAAASEDAHVAALAELAAGQVLAAEGDERSAGVLQAALRRFDDLNLPHETARAQLELARVLAETAPEAATAEARAALRGFERLGATPGADAAAALLRTLGSTGRAWPRRYGR